MSEVAASSQKAVPSHAICTLFEGDYHLGLAAFVNSLVRAGYAGTLWVGYRGALPPWLPQLKRLEGEGSEYMVADQIRLVFLPLSPKIHFASHKPQFMLDLFAGHARGLEYLWYFDPDIFLRCEWSFFADWQQCGIPMCQEVVNHVLPIDSPVRHKWMQVAAGIGLGNPRPMNYYFNSGMVSVHASQTSFLELWQRFIQMGRAAGGNIDKIVSGTRAEPFHVIDQDAFNIAAMYTEHPISTMGPEAMGFIPAGFTMYHTTGPKPWRGSVLIRAIKGFPPTEAYKYFFTQVTSPIRAYSAWSLGTKRLACTVAAFIGRFYRRT